jgi:hypothetical protein
MASRYTELCSPWQGRRFRFIPSNWAYAPVLLLIVLTCAVQRGAAQIALHATEPGETLNLMPSDQAILEEEGERRDIPCTVTERKPELGFDLRFHSGYEVDVPLRELIGNDRLTVLFRVYPEGDRGRSSYFVQHFQVPDIDDDAKGDALLQGGIDVGEGKYHVDWLMRDRTERICSSGWDVDAELSPKEKPIPLFLKPGDVEQPSMTAFFNETSERAHKPAGQGLSVKMLVNFAPQLKGAAALQRSDVDALVTILKTIQRDPHVARISLVAFNIDEARVVYRQDAASEIDFPAVGKALDSMKLGTINVGSLADKTRTTTFLQGLIETEMKSSPHPDAVVFAGPKAMLDADVPQEDLRRIGDVECPVFYLNYNLNPQAVPWKDSISHAIRVFKGTEFTISRPRDLWYSTTEVVNRIVSSKGDDSPKPSPNTALRHPTQGYQ